MMFNTRLVGKNSASDSFATMALYKFIYLLTYLLILVGKISHWLTVFKVQVTSLWSHRQHNKTHSWYSYSRIFRIVKINKMMPFCNLLMGWPLYMLSQTFRSVVIHCLSDVDVDWMTCMTLHVSCEVCCCFMIFRMCT